MGMALKIATIIVVVAIALISSVVYYEATSKATDIKPSLGVCTTIITITASSLSAVLIVMLHPAVAVTLLIVSLGLLVLIVVPDFWGRKEKQAEAGLGFIVPLLWIAWAAVVRLSHSENLTVLGIITIVFSVITIIFCIIVEYKGK